MFGGSYFGQPQFGGWILWLFTTTPSTAFTTWNAEPATVTSFNAEPTTIVTWMDTP